MGTFIFSGAWELHQPWGPHPERLLWRGQGTGWRRGVFHHRRLHASVGEVAAAGGGVGAAEPVLPDTGHVLLPAQRLGAGHGAPRAPLPSPAAAAERWVFVGSLLSEVGNGKLTGWGWSKVSFSLGVVHK